MFLRVIWSTLKVRNYNVQNILLSEQCEMLCQNRLPILPISNSFCEMLCYVIHKLPKKIKIFNLCTDKFTNVFGYFLKLVAGRFVVTFIIWMQEFCVNYVYHKWLVDSWIYIHDYLTIWFSHIYLCYDNQMYHKCIMLIATVLIEIV